MNKLDVMESLEIVINGKRLTTGQAMTVYVALQSIGMKLSQKKNSLGSDEHGRFMTKAYLDNIRAINSLYIK